MDRGVCLLTALLLAVGPVAHGEQVASNEADVIAVSGARVEQTESVGPTSFPMGSQNETIEAETIVESEIAAVDDGEFRGQIGFYWIRPQWDDNVGFGDFTTNDAVTAGTNSLHSFNYDFSFSPRVAASYILPGGLGFRARYWQFNQGKVLNGNDNADNTTLYTTEPLGFGLVSQGDSTTASLMSLNSGLKLYSLDMEVTKDLKFGNLTILYWGGMKYAHIAQDYDVVDALTGGPTQTLTSGHNLNGFGPTVGIEDRYAIGDTGLSFFGNIRGSLLAGNGKQKVSRRSALLGDFDASDSRNDLLPIGDLEVGGEYSFDVGEARFYIQLALVCQAWLGAGNSSRSNGSAQTSQIFPQLPDTSAVADGNLGLYGLTANLGVDW